MLSVTPRAAAHIHRLCAEEGYTHPRLRIEVKAGGCSGLTYDLSFADTLREGELSFHSEGIELIVPKKSLLYLAGTQLDFTDGLEGKGFHFINPNATRTCACGTSFAV
ncbi:MAG: iron-sulfur cluster assembly accessory protein [Bacteroidia bacterium]|nr:iron-sulfur cluster assembly accessory protein [Bacteroidia bacterium]MCX7651566.1 iron-sulfur cluster assembly accessory protein [Bacteroidia bacterium]MDW8417258.1 iron-sulfur cluster assembly accessory protein [Bacteroidia bacterium]